VEQQVVVFAERNSVSDIGLAAVFEPLVDVMNFGVARVWRTVIG
jgi:hypothetical protein